MSNLANENIVTKSRTETVVFRKEEFTVTYPCTFNKIENSFIEDERSVKMKNMLIHNKYREKYNLLFPEEIMEIRNKYGLSATKMSELLGFGVNSYRNYETGEVPSLSNANLILLASDPIKFKSLVLISSLFEENEDEKTKLLMVVDELIKEKEEENNKFFIRFEDYLMGRKVRSIKTGYVLPNLDKLTEMVVFFADKFKPYKTQLNKLLFYSDFYHYKLHAVSITGTRYRAINRGPVPDNYDSIFDFAVRKGKVKIKETVWANGFSEQFVLRDNSQFNSNLFTEEELRVLELVNDSFNGKNTKEIVDISHEEEAWIENYQNGKSLIDYKYAFNLKYMS